MKLFRSSLLLMGQTAALGWFILQDISFLAVLPLIPLGVVFYFLNRFSSIKWLNGIFALVSSVMVAFAVSVGVFDGDGFLTLLCLLIAVSLMAVTVPKKELTRISGWWLTAFLLIFVAMLIATLPGLRWHPQLPPVGNWGDILVFYLLSFGESFSLGKEYRGAPFALSLLLLPFSVAAYYALGSGAFGMAEYPYLSVWAGVSISAFDHIEGIILCLYYGVGVVRAAHFFTEF
jgi:hypothetical protein